MSLSTQTPASQIPASQNPASQNPGSQNPGSSDPVSLPLGLTERAARRINEIMAKEPDGAMLRISVNGGGCSGFQYAFDVDGALQDDDLVLERDGAKVLVDQISLQYMQGSVIDFVDDLIGQSFKIENPQATASCGCGTSFTI